MNRLIYIIVLLIVLSPLLLPHGVDVVTINGGTGIEAKYDSGDPISHAEVTVYSPENYEELFQSGVTDINGRFLFSPDCDGKWKVVINDLTGHGGIFWIKVETSSKSPAAEVEKSPGRLMKIFSGISVIFGLTGIIFFFMARRERKRGLGAHS